MAQMSRRPLLDNPLGEVIAAVVIAWAELWGWVTDWRRTRFARVTDEGEES